MRKFNLKYLLLAAVLSSVSLNYSCKEENKNREVKTATVQFRKDAELELIKAETDSIIYKLDVEIADDDYERETGLMYREKLTDHQGMLFVFPSASYHSFYMRNTRMPLDIIFISESMEVINIQKNAKPMDESSLPSEAPAKYVLEIIGGLSNQLGLNPGDKIRYN